MKTKINFFNYTLKDAKRPVFGTVYHECGYKIATDKRIMLYIKEDYPEEYEKKMLQKNGTFLSEGRYPNYISVIPKRTGYNPYQFDKDKFYKGIDDVREKTGLKKYQENWVVKIGGVYLNAELFNKFIKAVDYIGAKEVLIKDEMSPVFAQTDKGKVLLMPRLYKEENDVVIDLN